jgi:AcrR family transcriptional regulator
VGITPMAIYHHFPNRKALLRIVADKEFEKLLGFINTHRARGSAENRLLRIMLGYTDYAFAQPRIFDYVFSSVRPGARRYPQYFRAGRSPTLNPWPTWLGN